MKELSLNVLDIAENSAKAGALLIKIYLREDSANKNIEIIISDNGCGMDEDFLKSVVSPFTTTRTTRKIGLGIPLFKEAAEITGGSFEITSKVGEGTEVKATFLSDSIDCMPVGDMAGTFVTLVRGHPEIDFYYYRSMDDEFFEVSTLEIKQIMDGIPIDSYEVCSFITEFINENTTEILGGNI